MKYKMREESAPFRWNGENKSMEIKDKLRRK